ncbi:MAG: hypothetical protein ACE5E7_11945 [Anaerolineae bacterium]
MEKTHPHPYVEESFGILTDDELYLDCILVRPAETADEELKVLRVWVPKYPLTKSSVITCARQEVAAYGAKGKIAHLVFDLRNTGDSDTVFGDPVFDKDLKAITEWAKERFGAINFGFIGTPDMDEIARVNIWPLRAGAVMESYFYRPAGGKAASQSILYLSTYGHFRRADDVLCAALSDHGYAVYGVDPLRYLLHACAERPLTPDDLCQDLQQLILMLHSAPIIIGRPLAAGLALFWAACLESVRGVIAIGRAGEGLAIKHIFDHSNPKAYDLAQYMPQIAPRPLALVWHEGHPLGGSKQEFRTLFECSKHPHKMARTEHINPELLLNVIEWIEAVQPGSK